MAQRKSSLEGRGLLQSEDYDINGLDYLETTNGHARKNSRDRSKIAYSKRAKWWRSRRMLLACALVMLVLFAGAAMNKNGKFKIPQMSGDPFVNELASAATRLPPIPAHDSVASHAEDDANGPGMEDEALAQVEPAETSTPTAQEAESTPVTVPNKASVVGESTTQSPHKGKSKAPFPKPTGFKIIGLLFYGRPETVTILDCYLRKNLVRNGGFLDEVHFVVNTDKKDDNAWLDMVFDEVPEYKRTETHVKKQHDGYNKGWAMCNSEDMYIKIDDDIVWFSEDAIPNLVFSLMHHPEAFNVVATLVNSPFTGWLHRRMEAVHAYVPEKARKEADLQNYDGYGPTAWRASALPLWSGEDRDINFTVSGVRHGKADNYSVLPPDDPGAPPYKGHRWLPLAGNDREIYRTPIAQSQIGSETADWYSWSLGAQAQYSLLQNIENNTLHLYHIGAGVDPEREGIWNMAYERMNINLMAIWGKDVKDNLPFPNYDDEKALSVTIPQKLRRRKSSMLHS